MTAMSLPCTLLPGFGAAPLTALDPPGAPASWPGLVSSAAAVAQP